MVGVSAADRRSSTRGRPLEIDSTAELGRVAQWESARFTRERSQVRNPPRPSSGSPAAAGLSSFTGSPSRGVYAHAMRREEGDKERLKALVEGRDWAPLGTTPGQTPPADACGEAPENDDTRADAEASDDGRGGFRTCDLSRVKRALSH